MKKTGFVLWLLSILALFFYSFTQIDLNLTLTQVPIINQFVKYFQYIGFFQRPLSTTYFIFIIFLLFISYFLLLFLAHRGKINRREFWIMILFTTAILVFSYPALSYDIFNYMFDAKTIVYYHQNPWQLRPMDFKGDPWLSFMHWTHRPSVYPPIWIALSIPFFIFGFHLFLLILLNFKILMAVSFLGSIFTIEKLLNVNTKGDKNRIFPLVLYAFNPLLIIENLVSSHNDIVMIALALFSIWLAFSRKKIASLVTLVMSGLIKYLTLILVPIEVLLIKKKISFQLFYRISLLIVFVFFLFFISFTEELQPWYLVWLFPFIVLSGWKLLWPIVVGFSLGLLLRYAPFLYFGNWNYPVTIYKIWLTLVPLLFSIIISLLLTIKKRYGK